MINNSAKPIYYRFLGHLSIRNKILVVTMVVSSFAMLVTGITLLTYQNYAFRDWLAQNLTSQAEIIAQNSKGALAFNDKKEGLAVLHSLKVVSSMTGACLFRSDGSRFASWYKTKKLDPSWHSSGTKATFAEFEGEIILTHPITEQGVLLGTILLRSNQQDRVVFLQRSLGVMAFCVILSGAIAFFLSTWLQAIISEPIRHLSGVMDMVSKSQDYSLRAIRQDDDEIGDLTGYFNKMLAKIQGSHRQLQDNEDLLQSIINNANSLIYIKDLQGRYLMVNYRFRERILTNLDKIIGYSDFELFPEELAKLYTSSDKKVIAEGKLLETEEDLPHKKGLHTYISARFPLYDSEGGIYAICGIGTDITKRKQDEEELRQLRNYLSNVIDSMPSALIGLDSAGCITRWNHEAEVFTGFDFAEVKGGYLSDYLPQFKSQMVKVKAAIREREVKETAKFAYSSNGTSSFKDVTIYPLIANGIEGAVMRIDDVTERMQIEEMMVQTEKMMSVGGLAAGMAHEINNPLGIMVQAVQNIKRRVSPGIKANERVASELGVPLETICAYLENRMVLTMVDDIKEAGNRAAKIVDNMLQFSRQSESSRQAAFVHELVDKTVELASNDYDLKKKFDFRYITLIREYDERTPQVNVVITEFEQVILNILKNAAQSFVDKDMKEEKPTITLRVWPEDEAVYVEVADNGPGISEEIKARVFEPFFTTKPVGQGTGLGLSVSYMIITNNHGGSMAVESVVGDGTVFTIKLPLDHAQSTEGAC